MSAPTAAEIIKQVPQSLLDSQVCDVHISELAMEIERWEDFAPFFGLSRAQQEEIRRDNEGRYGLQKRVALWKWKEMKGKEATYRQLIIVFCCLHQNELGDSVKRLLLPMPKGQKSSGSILDTFRSYLVDCYAQTPHPSQNRWPFSRTAVYVDLPLFEAPLTEREPGSQEELPPLKLVELDTIFADSHNAERKVVLLEGVAGSGKTNLTWHACQKWAKEELFQQFPLLIHVSLADPAIRSATCLADIIPHPSSEMREAVAKAIAEQHGKKVCFLLDGWDEAHPDLQPFIDRFLAGSSGRSMLPRCSIIVTSRPVASGSLYRLLTSRVVVGKLNRASLDDLLNACLTPEEIEKLLKILHQNSQLASLCNLPINTAIVVHLFRCGHRSLPETHAGLFKALVRNLLLRHLQLRTEHDVREIGEEFEFDDLPAEILEKFVALSTLAFRGIRQKSGVFSTSNLKSEGLEFPFDTLSLMEAHLTSFGFNHSFVFLHYSVQEFLAAWHMSRLGSEEQAKAVSDVLHSSPLSPVLLFFAGLTGLSSPAVRDILLEVTKHPLDDGEILSNKPQTESEDRRRLALALLNCIYETQDHTLCELIKPPANPAFNPQVYECNISFWCLGLSPRDCLSIGYFMAHHRSCNVDLIRCFLSESGIEALLNQLMKTPVTSRSCVRASLNLSQNRITSKSMKLVSKALVEPSHLHVPWLFLDGSWLSSQAAINLMYLIEAFCKRSFSIEVLISRCNITTKHIHLLVLLLTTCRCIRMLGLSGNDIGGAMALIAKGLEQNTTLQAIILDHCNIGDESLTDLGKALQTHKSIRSVWLAGNSFSQKALIAFLNSQFHSRLEHLEISRPLNGKENHIYRELLLFRAMNSMPLLLVNRQSEQGEKTVHTADNNLLSLPRRVQSRVYQD